MKPLAISHGAPLVHCPDAPKTLPDCLYRAAGQSPDRGIVYFHADGSEEFQSYPMLLKEARQLLGGLKDAGLERGDRVIFQLDRNEDFIRAFWACIIGGFVPVPIGSALMPGSGAAGRLRNAWKTLGHPIILTANRMIDSVRDCFNFQELMDLRVEAIGGLSKAECDPDAHHGELDHLAVLMLTSGSTGAAKAVRLSHANLLSRSCASIQMNGFSPRDVSLNWMLLDHVAGLIYFHLRDVYLGCQQVHAPTEVVLTNPLKWLDLIEQYRATISFAPNFAYGLINDRAQELSRRHWDLSSMRVLLNGGEAIVAKTARHFLTLLCPHGLSPYAMRPGWGMSETSSGITYADTFSLDSTTDEDSFVEVGRPIAGVSLRIVDEQDNLVEEERIGSLQVKGLPVTAGYYGRPEADRETFTDDGWLKTGDLGFLSHGRLTITGREKDVIIINGVNYPSHEIESVVEEIAGVESSYTAACAVRNQDAQTDKLAVFFHPSSEQHWPLSPLLKDIRRSIARKLGIGPDYLLPMEKQDIPKTSIGKIQRSQLAQRFRAGEFDLIVKRFASSEVFPDSKYVAPRTAVEEMLAEIWAEVLKLNKVGIDDNFFELGGHSLLAIQVTSGLRRVFQIELPLRRLFESPTVAGLAEAVEEARGKGLRASPIVPASRTAHAPLSFAQQRLWVLDQLEPNRSVYNMPSSFRLEGRLDIVALEQSFNEIIRRHEALRTTFSMVDGEAFQITSPSLVITIPVVDLSDRSESERENEARRLAHEEGLTLFDLSQGPLLRVTLVRLGEQDYVLLLTLHHIVSDGWSMGVLFRELSALYRAYCAGKPSPLPALPIQYVDYTQWQRQWFQSEKPVEQIDYWRNQLDGAPRVLELPADHPRPPIQTYTGASESLLLSTNLSESLRSLGRKQNTTLYMTLLAAFSVLLHRHTGENEIVVGTPIAGRNRSEIEGLIGYFLNHLVLRVDLSDNPSFRELLNRVRETAIGAYSHQDLPFERLLEELRPERELSRTPLFQVYFNMLGTEDPKPDLPGITIEPMTLSEPESKFDLTLYIRTDKKKIRFDLVYNTSLFDRPRMVEMLKQLEHLLSQIIENPETRIERLSLVTSNAAPILPNPTSKLDKDWYGAIHDRLAEQARTRPGQLAIVDPWGKWSYETLDLSSNQLANYLRSGGIQSEDIVAIYGHRSAALVCAILGVLKAGAAFLILDPAYPASRVLDCTQQAAPRGWLQLETTGPLPDPVKKFAETLPSMRRLELPRSSAGISEVVNKFPIDNPGVSVGPDDLAYVSFTSGSTGRPNGILGRHGPLTHFLPWQEEAFKISASDRFSMLSGLSHDPLQRDVFTPLWAGATICIPDPDIIGTSKLANWMAEEAITFAHLTPPMLTVLADTAERGQRITSLRHVFFVGDSLTHREVERVRCLSPQVTCIASYGATETQRAVGYHVIAPDSDWRNHRSKPEYPLGRGMADAQLLVLNGERQLAGIGEFGEIYVRSSHLARGYLNDATLSAAKFLSNPFTKNNDDRLYKTGDMGRYLPDGNVEFAYRIDDQVKIRGYRIELGEIESVLAHHPGIRETVVATQQDRAGDKQIIAYIVPQEVAPITSELRDYLKAKLPDYMVPSAFVIIDSLPLTPNGKLDRKALPIPDLLHRAQGKTYREPCTPLEEKIAAIWADVLRVDKVGMDNNFFDLGGHSLLATQAVSRMRALFNCDIPLRTLFEAPTVGDLAKIIRAQQARQASETAMERLLEELEAISDEDAERGYKGQVTKPEE